MTERDLNDILDNATDEFVPLLVAEVRRLRRIIEGPEASPIVLDHKLKPREFLLVSLAGGERLTADGCHVDKLTDNELAGLGLARTGGGQGNVSWVKQEKP